jgi:hypothetical protein
MKMTQKISKNFLLDQTAVDVIKPVKNKSAFVSSLIQSYQDGCVIQKETALALKRYQDVFGQNPEDFILKTLENKFKKIEDNALMLKGKKVEKVRVGSAFPKINQAYKEIVQDNKKSDDKIAITFNVLFNKTGCSHPAIRTWIRANQDMIDAYHKKIKITDPKEHNRKQGLKMRTQNKQSLTHKEEVEPVLQDVSQIEAKKEEAVQNEQKEVALESPLKMREEFKVKMVALMEEGNLKEFKRVCTQENKKLRTRYPVMTTLRRQYTFYRNIAREHIKEEPYQDVYLKIMNLKRYEIDNLNKQYAQKVSQEHRNLREFRNPDEMIGRAVDLLNSSSLYDVVIALSFLTGRRLAEIGCTAKFQILPKEKEWMLFDGQLKLKNRLEQTYKIPVLTQPRVILNALEQLRAAKPEWIGQMQLFNDKAASNVSKRVKKNFAEFIDDPEGKDLRAAYAEICYNRFAPIRTAKTRFFSDILGHGKDDNLTGQSYVDFFIKE